MGPKRPFNHKEGRGTVCRASYGHNNHRNTASLGELGLGIDWYQHQTKWSTLNWESTSRESCVWVGSCWTVKDRMCLLGKFFYQPIKKDMRASANYAWYVLILHRMSPWRTNGISCRHAVAFHFTKWYVVIKWQGILISLYVSCLLNCFGYNNNVYEIYRVDTGGWSLLLNNV